MWFQCYFLDKNFNVWTLKFENKSIWKTYETLLPAKSASSKSTNAKLPTFKVPLVVKLVKLPKW